MESWVEWVLYGYSAVGGGGETRYARPWRPVKPLEIMEEVGMRSVRHLAQRRWEGWTIDGRKVGWFGGEEDGELVVEVEVVVVEERRRWRWRRRNGMGGRR